ncbi:cobaltochelatase subunit CobN [Allostella vacuolata]|nr:cobaltochelatase subunit CobN [Stella vacuolata]
MLRLAWLILGVAALSVASLLPVPSAAAPAGGTGAERPPVVRIVANHFVLPGKLAKIRHWAAEAGVDLASVYVEGEDPVAALAGADLVLLDTPRPNDLAAVQARVGPGLAEARIPWVRIGGGPPAFAHIEPGPAQRLAAYYGNGGEANLRAMADYIRQWHRGGTTAGIPAPAILPGSGLYHPDAPAVFGDVAAYLAWGAGRWPAGAPRVAFAVHAGTVAGMQTRVVDALVAGSEARGMVPLVFWYEAAEPQALQAILVPAQAELLVNLQHMQNGPARQAEFLALDIPVLQTLSYRDGDRAAWRQASSGVQAHLVAPFLSLPESWGMSDPLVIDVVEDGEPVPIEEQVAALLDKARALARLRRTAPAEKRLAVMFWNYPAGEKNLSASHLNIPRSLEALTDALAAAGHAVPPLSEARAIAAGQAMLAGHYRPETLSGLRADGLAEALPLSTYRQWFDGLPEAVQSDIVDRWGEPEADGALRPVDGAPHFIIPALRLGNLLLLPQPPRGPEAGHSYHDAGLPPNHAYLAAYLMLRQAFDAHALVHFGTHGTQEWTPGKDRGLSAQDIPFLAVGDLPVFYPYIQDNVGEAIQARRRGRAVTVSHQTPAFAPAGLYAELTELHALVHEHGQLAEGAVRDRAGAGIRQAVAKAGLDRDLGWDEGRMAADFDGFLALLHDHLHELARTAMPLGLHTFGRPAAAPDRLLTVMQQLGEPYYRLLDPDPHELFAAEPERIRQSEPYRRLHRHLREAVPVDEADAPELRALLARAGELDRQLADTQELEALLAGLAGRFVAPGAGGDPVRNPDIRGGRNLFAFEPDKIPTPAAYAAGGDALARLLAAHRAQAQGRTPEKLAFSLWSSEAQRHLGMLEGQVLHALGLRPAWDRGGRVRALDIIPAAELGRPRIDVVVQVTSVYRDQFDGFMRLLADAIERLARLDEPGNPVARNSRAVAARLAEKGMAAPRAEALSTMRIFSNQPGDYGSGLPEATLHSAEWETEAPLAEQFLSRLQFAYGAREWGVEAAEANLFAAQLQGVEAAVLSRTSKLHGVLSTDHPFEYLGGLALAVRHLDGASPKLYVADLRDPALRITEAGRFLADELRGRYLNPQWIRSMQAEGYAGTLQMVNLANNLWGWQVTAPETVRADQWQAVHDTFVRDSRQLGLDAWFEVHNPTAQAQVIERMLEAVRKDYWRASEETRRQLVERWQQLAAAHGVQAGAPATRAFVEAQAAGFGLAQPAGPAAPPVDAPAGPAPESQTVQGQVLRDSAVAATAGPVADHLWMGLGGLALCLLAGGAAQWRRNAMTSRVERS